MTRYWLYIITLIALFSSCSKPGPTEFSAQGEELATEAKYLSLKDCGDYLYAEVYAPWADSIPLARYIIPTSDESRIDVAEGITLIDKPLAKTIVSSSIYTSGLQELGLIDAVAGVTDGDYYIPGDPVRQRLDEGSVVNIGSSMSPSKEKAIDLDPDGVVISPYEGSGLSSLEQIGVPVVLMTDYLEASPLGRAQWILLLGAAYGKLDEARAIYEKVAADYRAVSSLVADVKERPKVLSEKPMSGVWYVPGGNSYVARMIRDAGASTPWDDSDATGSLPLDEASVIDRAADVDFWLVKSDNDLSADALRAEFPHAGAFEAFPDKVYVTNTLKLPYFNAIAYHPEKVLRDMVAIFHPEALDSVGPLQFYEKLK